MGRTTKRKPRPPLTAETLGELALFYVGRFATTRAKLKAYLQRKVRERGWDGEPGPDVDSIAERFAVQGYIDDAAYAVSKSRSLTSRGYGLRRVEQALRGAGIEEGDGAAARQLSQVDSVESALRFAERRRLGPFASQAPDQKVRQRALAAMLRAGHGFALSRAILDLPPGASVDPATLSES